MTEPRIRYQLSVAEAAERLGVSEGAVRQRIRRGTLDIRRKGRRLVVLLSESDVEVRPGEKAPGKAESVDSTRTVQHQTWPASAGTDEPMAADGLVSGESTRTVQAESRPQTETSGEPTVPRSELERANQAYDELAEAWARDLRHQLERLERQVDRLQGELSDMRQRHAEEMRRKDVLLQGNQEALAAWIGRLTGTATTLPSQKPGADA